MLFPGTANLSGEDTGAFSVMPQIVSESLQESAVRLSCPLVTLVVPGQMRWLFSDNFQPFPLLVREVGGDCPLCSWGLPYIVTFCCKGIQSHGGLGKALRHR